MSHEPPILAEAELLEVLDRRSCIAALPNGKRVHAHLPRGAGDTSLPAAGSKLTLELSPYDFSRARIRIPPEAPPQPPASP